MEVSNLSIPIGNKLVNNYLSGVLDTASFFDYDISSPNVYEERKNDLLSRVFPREDLVNHLLSFNERYGCHENTILNIKKLLNPNSVVVIGGQQAGLLTGPLYTIYKVISIIKLAEQQEKHLNIPVVPVFWIAGEDHDFAEINHLFIKDRDKIRKKIIPQRQLEKMTVSMLKIEKDVCSKWISDIFESFGETDNTNELITKVYACLEKSNTYVDFFSYLINDLFTDSGLVIIDSASSELRKIESDFFTTMIQKNSEIRNAVFSQQSMINDSGYKLMIDVQGTSANIFYHYNNERVLLEYDEDTCTFQGKNNKCTLTVNELLHVAKEEPEKLSNNVVTRPLMQEFLFPSLAFISGPGEVAYWAELKQVFSIMGIKMPPIVPRVTISILERSIERDMQDLDISLLETLSGKLEDSKNRWIENQVENNLDDLIEHAKQEVERIHKRLRDTALEIDNSLNDVLLKNASLIQSQLEFVNTIVKKKVYLQHEVELNKFRRVEMSLLPNKAPQERVWNIYYYLNKYGKDFVVDLLKLPIEVDGKHKIVKV